MVGLRAILSAELLSVGSELTVGETRDTNAGDLARSLTELGISVGRIQAVPDDLRTVTDAFVAALERVDLVVSTGGLGPTPDDLTREAISAAVGEEPAVDPDLELWLRGLWSRRGLPMPDLNLKQAWLIASATALPNAGGTAPGWWVERPDGRLIVALPGPPREMRPIWLDSVLPRLRERGAGAAVARRTFRLAGIGESAVADRLGEAMLRAANPMVATYARADAVDVRISARGASSESAATLVDEAASRVVELLGDHIWAEGETTWADAIGAELGTRGWTLACVEVGSGGSFSALLGDRDWLRIAESLATDAPAASGHADAETDAAAWADGELPAGPTDGLEELARRAAQIGGADVGVGVRVRGHGGDTAVTIVVTSPARVHRERRLAFLGGRVGRSRAALVAAAAVLFELRRIGPPAPVETQATGLPQVASAQSDRA
jgi:nicotinamide-nucleotide amidase